MKANQANQAKWEVVWLPVSRKWSVRQDGREVFILNTLIGRDGAAEIEQLLRKLDRAGARG